MVDAYCFLVVYDLDRDELDSAEEVVVVSGDNAPDDEELSNYECGGRLVWIVAPVAEVAEAFVSQLYERTLERPCKLMLRIGNGQQLGFVPTELGSLGALRAVVGTTIVCSPLFVIANWDPANATTLLEISRK